MKSASKFSLFAMSLFLAGSVGCGGPSSDIPPTPYQKVAQVKYVDDLQVELNRPDGNRFLRNLRAELWYKGAAPDRNRCLNVAVHGAGEGRWTYSMEAPANNLADYTYVNYVTDVCDVLTFDMPGVGRNPATQEDRDGLTMTATTAGSLIRQVVKFFTDPDGVGYSKVFLTGHSVGSIDVLAGYPYEPHVTGLVITGLVLTPHPLGNGLTLNDFLGYATTPFPTYSDAFWAKMAYYQPGLIPLKDKYGTHEMSLAQLQAGIVAAMNPGALRTNEITTDVLLVSGDQDALYPGGFLENDAATFYANAKVEIVVPEGVGHATFMHVASPGALASIRDWIKARN